jgi:hypothetical protein
MRRVVLIVWFTLIGLFAVAVVYLILTERQKTNYFQIKTGDADSETNSVQVRLKEFDITKGKASVRAGFLLAFKKMASLQTENRCVLKVETSEFGSAEYDLEGCSNDDEEYFIGYADIFLSPERGTHSLFPLDDLFFSLSFWTEPKVKFGEVYFYNDLESYVLNDKPECTMQSGKTKLEFELKREIFIKIFCLVVAFTAALFVFLIIGYVNEVAPLAMSLGGFFISLWSIRGRLGVQIETFPTAFDYYILSLTIILLVGILTKILIRYQRAGGHRNKG